MLQDENSHMLLLLCKSFPAATWLTVSRGPEVTCREGALASNSTSSRVVAAEVAKDTDILLAWKIDVSTVILPANLISGFKGIEKTYAEPALTSR